MQWRAGQAQGHCLMGGLLMGAGFLMPFVVALAPQRDRGWRAGLCSAA